MIAIGILTLFIVLWVVWRIMTSRRNGLLENVGISARIKADLLTELGAKGAHVECSKRVVILSGSVPYAEFREVAGHLARRRGARQVINKLQVVPSAPGRTNPYLPGLPRVKTPACTPAAMPDLSLGERVESKEERGLSMRTSPPYAPNVNQADRR